MTGMAAVAVGLAWLSWLAWDGLREGYRAQRAVAGLRLR